MDAVYDLSSAGARVKFDGSGNTQTDRVVKILRAASGAWVSALDLSRQSGALQYCRCVAEARAAGHLIENKVEFPNGQKRGFYRYLGWAAPIETESPAKKPASVASTEGLGRRTAPQSLFSEPLVAFRGGE